MAADDVATVLPSPVEGSAATMGGVETLQVVQAMFRGLAQGGASRQVVAAAAAAVFRSSLSSCRSSELDDTELVAVPREVVDKVRPVAAAMAVQGIVGDLLDARFHSTGQAYEALRQHEPALAVQVRALNRVANIAKHGKRRGGRRSFMAEDEVLKAKEVNDVMHKEAEEEAKVVAEIKVKEAKKFADEKLKVETKEAERLAEEEFFMEAQRRYVMKLAEEKGLQAREAERLKRVAKDLAENLVSEAKTLAEMKLTEETKEAEQLINLAGTNTVSGWHEFKVKAERKRIEAKKVAEVEVAKAKQLADELVVEAAMLAKFVAEAHEAKPEKEAELEVG
jgi:hypothetical protein